MIALYTAYVVRFDSMSKLSVKNSLLAAICVNSLILSVTYLSTHPVVDARKQSKIATGMALRPPFGSRPQKFPDFPDSGKNLIFQDSSDDNHAFALLKAEWISKITTSGIHIAIMI